ncbi:MAG: transcriptional repressor [Gammaproteobacteria bacterium]
MNTQMFGNIDVVDLMREHGITPTQQRVEIAQVLFSRPQHLSAEQVLALVNRDRHVVSKATIYNTLGLFVGKGLIREIIIDPAKVFYDPTTSPHHHFYNVDTGALMDIAADAVALSKLPDLPDGTVAEGVDVVVRIRNCRRATAE